jgi:hypothetical protein
LVDLTFRGTGPWGPGKGANLQPAEVDDNFWEIATAVLNLETNPALPTGIQSITISGTQMTITLTDGSVMGPYTIPVLVMRWRDEWQPATPYAVLDVFKVTGVGIFLVELAHVSGDVFDPRIAVDGDPALMQLFGSVDVTLSGLPDVSLQNLNNGDVLIWNAGDQLWENTYLGRMAYQDPDFVQITGGTITGLAIPFQPTDVRHQGIRRRRGDRRIVDPDRDHDVKRKRHRCTGSAEHAQRLSRCRSRRPGAWRRCSIAAAPAG